MLRGKARLIIQDGVAHQSALNSEIEKLKDGDYSVLVFDDKKNRTLPQLKYLFGVVLKQISDQLPTHPSVDALYRYFEKLYAPKYICDLPEGQFEYCNLKNEKQNEVNEVTESIIHHATEIWKLNIDTKEGVTKPEAKEIWAGAYEEQWNQVLSPNNHIFHK